MASEAADRVVRFAPRALLLEYGERATAGLMFNELGAYRKKVKAPIVMVAII